MLATTGRFSILMLMVVVSMVAADLAIIRGLWDMVPMGKVLIVLPMLNFMVLGLPGLRREGRSRQYWVGFEAMGMALLVLASVLEWQAWPTLIQPYVWLKDHGWLANDVGASPETLAVACAAVVAIYTLPQLLAASLAGWLSSRFQRVIRGRPRAIDVLADGPRPAIDR